MTLNSLDNFRRNEPAKAVKGKESTLGFDAWRRSEPARSLVGATSGGGGGGSAHPRVQLIIIS